MKAIVLRGPTANQPVDQRLPRQRLRDQKRVDWFNNRRVLEPIGDIPPVELERLYYGAHTAPAMVAGVN